MDERVNEQALTNLGPAARRLTAVLARPKTIAIVCAVVLMALGTGVFSLLHLHFDAALEAVCGPSLASARTVINAALVLAMWQVITLAMMLPTAGPMILTYAELADTAIQKNKPVVTPIVLAAGYLAIWDTFATGAASLQASLVSSGFAEVAKTPIPGAIFIAAGLYQFSRLKVASLTHCPQPFPFFLANWTTRTLGVFLLGLRQGAYCLLSCWAPMLFIFAVGAINVAWMAILGTVMTIEQIKGNSKLSRALSIVLVIVGAAFIALELK